MRRFSATTKPMPRSSKQPADDRAVRALEHLDDLALGPAAPVGARAARGRAVAVQHLVHFARIEEEIGAAVVRDQEAEAVGMALDAAADEVELGGDAQLALAVQQQLAVALHRFDAAEERVAGPPIDRHRAREFRGGKRYAVLQRFQDRDARREQRRIDVVTADCVANVGSQHSRRTRLASRRLCRARLRRFGLVL